MHLSVQNLTKAYDGQPVLWDVSFTFEQGKIYGLLGRNGAGKTTFFNCINEDIPCDGGSVLLETDDGQSRRLTADDIGYVLSEPIVPDFLTAREMMKFYLEINEGRIENPLTPDAYLDTVQLEAESRDKLMRDFSHGMKNKMQMLIHTVSNPAVLLLPSLRPPINGVLPSLLPKTLFVLYAANRGGTITQLLFLNCDQSLLPYRFYRRPDVILSMFRTRLMAIIRLNLLPALVLAVGLILLLFVTGGTPEPILYPAMFFTVISISLFFSVHYLAMYYLLQPYTVNLEKRSTVYNLVMAVPYLLSYATLNADIPTLPFAIAATVFALIYIPVSLLLVYRLAPRTFRL